MKTNKYIEIIKQQLQYALDELQDKKPEVDLLHDYVSDSLRLVKNLTIPDVSGLLLRSKAKEYAKFKHQDEYNDPIYHRDVLETLNDFEAGYKAAIKDCNNH